MTRRALLALTAALASPWLPAAPRTDERGAAARVELPGKPTGPIAVAYRAAEPAVGVPLTIAVTARAAGRAAGLTIEANATDPRAVLVTPPRPAVAGEGAYAWEVTVVPLAADAGYLTIVVSGVVDGVEQARSVTIPLRAAAAAPAPAVATDGGETLIALPVQESS